MNSIKKASRLIILCVLLTHSVSAQLTFSMQCTSPSTSITCTQGFVTYYAVSNYSAAINYTWLGSSSTDTGSPVYLFTPGIYTVTAMSGSVTSTQTLSVPINTIVPSGSITPMFQAISCNFASVMNVSATAVGAATNLVHSFLSPYGGTFVTASMPAIYAPFATGTYTHFLTNSENGCSLSQQFTVSSSQAIPTFDLASPNSYSLGCGPYSVAVVYLQNGQVNPPASLSYTIIPPNTTTVLPSGALSGASAYTMATPGNYTAVIREANTSCEARVPFTVTQKTVTNIEVVSNSFSLSCLNPTVSMQVLSVPAFTSVFWQCPSGNSTSFTCNATNIGYISSYSCVVTGTTAGRCVSSKTLVVYGDAQIPTITPGGPYNLCSGPNLIITAVLVPSTRVYTYTWTCEPGKSVSSPNTASSTVTQAGTYTVTAFDSKNQCEKSVSIIVNDCVGLNEFASEFESDIYPNPATNYVYVKHTYAATNYRIEITDLSGRVVKQVFSQSQISIEDLNTGLYLLHFISDGQTKTERLLISR